MEKNNKPIAIVFSDLHLADYPKFNIDNKRTLSHFRVLSKVQKLCLKYNCPAICAGDLIHKPEILTNEFFTTLVNQFTKLNKKPWSLYCISGNHDMQNRNTIDNPSTSWVNSLSKLFTFMKPLDFKSYDLGKFILSGVPYLDHNIGLNLAINERAKETGKPNILILHSDFPGAEDTDGTEVGEVENLNINLLMPFKLVLMGHIHKPQKLGKKVYMIGAPLQQRRTDRDCDLGCWLIMEDFTMKFINWRDKFPRFIDVTSEEDIKDDGNYYTIVQKSPSSSETQINHGVLPSTSKSKMVRKYLKVIGIKDKQKKQVLTNIIKEASGDDI